LNISNTIKKTNEFIDKLEYNDEFKLFERSEVSPYARCFVIFVKFLIKQNSWLKKRREKLIYFLNIDLHNLYKKKIGSGTDIKYDKAFLQLFCFTLSSLNILEGELDNENLEIFKKLLDIDVKKSLKHKGVDKGLESSGNHSMFISIINIYANDHLKIDRSSQIQEWIDFNSKTINSNGFWGKNSNIDYLQFQNGYHQYEIFEYLKFTDVPWSLAAKKTMLMADRFGHFAPYPGGGGCYDYDAIFILTSEFVNDIGQKNVLLKTLNSITNEQNTDGGFCETRNLKNIVWPKLINIIKHIIFQPSHLRFRSIFINLNLMRLKNRYYITHWTHTDRKWEESNAWDTFFRLLTIYRICKHLDMPEKNLFQINNFPGIG